MDGNAEQELPVSKEERIKLALSYIKEQYDGDDSDLVAVENSAKKNGIRTVKYDKAQRTPTIRQIAMYFKIPKSTLYDRMKACQGQKRQRTPTRMRTRTQTQTQTQTTTNNPLPRKKQKRFDETGQVQVAPMPKEFTHSSQMKFSPEMESLIVRNIQGYVLAFGNLPLIADLRECVSLITRTKTFGNKWISGFIRRHAEESIYGSTSATVPNATFKDFKLWKNKQGQLNAVFLQQLQERLRICDQFQHLCIYKIRQAEPVASVKHVMLALDVKVLETKSGRDVSLELLCDPTVINDRVVALSDTNASARAPSPSHTLTPVDPLIHLLQSVLKHIPTDKTQLVILEGLTHLEHWSWSQCIELVTEYNLNNKLFAVPWGNHLLAKSLQLSLQDSFLSNITASQLAPASRILKELVNDSAVNSQFRLLQRQRHLVDPKDALQKLLDTICKNESRIYRELHNPETRITLCDIFNQVRIIAESMSTS